MPEQQPILSNRVTTIEVTEPLLCADGTWEKATFVYRDMVVITPRDRVARNINPTDVRDTMLLDLVRWALPLPPRIYSQEPGFSRTPSIVRDNEVLRVVAEGAFELGDEAETEAMMEWVKPKISREAEDAARASRRLLTLRRIVEQATALSSGSPYYAQSPAPRQPPIYRSRIRDPENFNDDGINYRTGISYGFRVADWRDSYETPGS